MQLTNVHGSRLQAQMRVVVMNNLFQNMSGLAMHRKYDLKGSTQARFGLESLVRPSCLVATIMLLSKNLLHRYYCLTTAADIFFR